MRPALRLALQGVGDLLEVHRVPAAGLRGLGTEEQHALVSNDLRQIEHVLAEVLEGHVVPR
eukprot:6419535-Alexandrium_andersonii.AAC.1